uniref:Uncharacterized protein n=1 Tax=Haptolina brevifila TaxID=156173 RepID=A0A7S2CDT0_9EUKA
MEDLLKMENLLGGESTQDGESTRRRIYSEEAYARESTFVPCGRRDRAASADRIGSYGMGQLVHAPRGCPHVYPPHVRYCEVLSHGGVPVRALLPGRLLIGESVSGRAVPP